MGRAKFQIDLRPSSYLINMKLSWIILEISLHNRYEQDFLGAEKDVRISKFIADVICTCPLVSPSQKSLSPRYEK